MSVKSCYWSTLEQKVVTWSKWHKAKCLGILRKKKWIKARKIKAAILYWEGDKLEWSNNVIHSFMSTITVIKTRKAKSYQMSIISIS